MRLGSIISRFCKDEISRFCKDDRGTVAILWGTAMVVFIGFLAITLDIGRLSATQSELQSFADNVALAAAGELDGKNDAITRATNAAANLIDDSQTFANGSNTLSGSTSYTLTFHSALPASDATPLGGAVTTVPNKAKFAQVVLTPKSLSMSLASGLDQMLGGNGFATTSVNAEAVAGYTQAACDISPLMFCLPPNWETTLGLGDQIELRSGGGGTAAWGPGNFGFIDLATFQDSSGVCAGKGGNKLACLIAAQSQITQCVLTNGLTTEPGQKVGITNAAFNVRFDMYRAVLNGEKNNIDFAPAPNVIKGIKPKGGGSCIKGNHEDTDTMALGRDTCILNGTCGGSNRFGDGVWDRTTYLNTNHDLADGTADNIGSDTHLPALTGTDIQYAGTRFGMYLREIAYGNTDPFSNPNANAIVDPSLGETGRPMCSNKMSTDPARRVVTAAGIDCAQTVIKGSTSNVPVTQFVSVFLTEPVGDDGGSPAKFGIYGEVVGFPDPAGGGESGFGGIFRDVVQLYR